MLSLVSMLNQERSAPTSHDFADSNAKLGFSSENRITLFLILMESSDMESAVFEIKVPFGQKDLIFLEVDPFWIEGSPLLSPKV